MAFFDDLKDKAMDLGRAGVAKSKELAEIAKLNLANSAEEDAIKKAYTEIGKLYYAERGMAPDAAYASLCEKITASRTTIEMNKAQIADIKDNDDVAAPVAEAPAVDANVPPEEPHCDCGCEDHKE